MPNFRRAFQPGGTFFFTVVTYYRIPFLCDEDARRCLRSAIAKCRTRWPFDLVAIVLLPDHLHTIWTLPVGDSDFSRRWASLKRDFTSEYLAVSERERRVTAAQSRDRRRGIWQPRFWEHRIRDESDLERHLNDIHYNPVKHGLAMCPHHWPYSSFGKWTRSDVYEPTWQCACDGRRPEPMNFDDLPLDLME